MAQLLDRAELEKPHRDHVKVMLEAGRGLKTLLDDVITLTRAEDEVEESEDCDPTQAARAVARLLQPRAWEKNLRLNVVAPTTMSHVSADPRRVRQVLLKLADNALKFTDRGGVEIRVEQEKAEGGNEWVRFSVIDTGHGIPSEVVPVLFKPFTPGDSSYARRQQGAGLGLAVAKRLVESFGGDIGFESEPGQGANFWFTVALAQENTLVTTAAEDVEAAPPSGLKLLLFVKDRSAREQIAKFLEPFGNKISTAENLADAAGQAGKTAFDAILTEGDDADMLAAAPGVKAPIVALIAKSGRAPLCAEEIVRWPASAATIYATFRALKARAKDMTDAELVADLPAAIDAATFAGLEKSVGLPTLLEILKSYVEASNKLCESLTDACGQDNWEEASRLAQDIAGAAGGLGLSAITTAARAMASKAREGESRHELRNAAQAIIVENERATLALINLYPDLAA
jgi:HPt (histidine-containing phosphotransfer) domain-containing protein